MSHRAEVQYYSHDFRAAVATCRDILQRDPYHLTCLPVYLCTLHELQQKNELFYRESWHAVVRPLNRCSRPKEQSVIDLYPTGR
eukprot:COSAG02_NODE_684_length_18490_cov_14.283019_5_plen_84_part_00